MKGTYGLMKERLCFIGSPKVSVWEFTKWYRDTRNEIGFGYTNAQAQLVELPIEEFRELVARFKIEEEE